MAKRKSQSDHDEMVEVGAKYLVDNAYTGVKADIPGWNTPAKKFWKNTDKGHVPDITGEGNPNVTIEVETADSVNDEHTADQWNPFLEIRRTTP